jgi:hypothetical protein
MLHISGSRLTLVRADASQHEWFACNGVAVHAPSRAALNKALGVMNTVPRVLLLSALHVMWIPPAIAETFSFGDLHLRTTAEDLRHRYPASKLVGNYMYIAPSDSHDHIYGIQLPAKDGAGRLKLFFERPDVPHIGRERQYPRCDRLMSALRAKYGPPDTVEEYSEERARNRRLSWRRSQEVLALHCFRLHRVEFLAEALTIDVVVQ